ncbi:MAG: AfsR/SARP family transcriptional regulator [Actinomycetota bacterium]|nr:AfsR/SARP family transcriptional regulator [Actinomycetota bacterium]
MRLMLLGPLQLVDDAGERVMVAGPRQRFLLAALAAHANQPVSLDALAEVVWDGAPPPGGIATLRTHLARLRRCLGPCLACRIVTRASGYAIELNDDELDLLAFENHCRRAGAALRATDNTQASTSGALALSLWRGEPLSDVPSQLLRDLIVPQFERQRVQVVEDWIEAELRLGHHGPVLDQLRDLTARYPLRERFHAQLMLALAHSGRRAEALTAYQAVHKTLVAELGVEPGRELRALHERILAGDELLPDTPRSDDRAPARPPARDGGSAATARCRQALHRPGWRAGLAD